MATRARTRPSAQPQSPPPGPSRGSAWTVSRVSISPRPAASSTPSAPMPSARRPAPLTSAPSSICAAPRAEASSARAAAASGSAARSTSSQRTIAPSVSGRPNSIRAAARRPGSERTASPGPASRSRSCGRGPTVITRAPRRRALRTRSSTIACWLAGSPPTTTTRPARSISPSWADGSARSASSPPPGTPSRCTTAPGRAARGELLGQEALLDRRGRPDEDPDPAGAAQHQGRRVHGVVEAHLPDAALVLDDRGGEAVGGVVDGVREAREVGEPALLHLVVRVRPARDPRDLALARGQLHVGAGGVVAADRGGVGDVPGPRDEAVRDARQRADGAEVDDVAGEAALVVVAREGADLAAGAAVLHDQRAVLGDVLAEADAAEARDAALAVERDERREVEGLREVALGLDEARDRRPEPEGAVLQRALAALVADRAVERVVLQQELQDAVLPVAGDVGVGAHHHVGLDGRAAGGLEAAHALHLDQAHAARADRRAQARLVAEDRHLDAVRVGGVHQHRPGGRGHAAAVELELDLVRRRPG